jgi:hypothetical protein
MGAKVPATFLNCQKKCKRRTKKLHATRDPCDPCAPCAPQVWRQPIRLQDFGPWIKYSDAAKQTMFIFTIVVWPSVVLVNGVHAGHVDISLSVSDIRCVGLHL